MHSTQEVFQIFCTVCNAERMATKHARQHIDDFGGYVRTRKRPLKWIGVNRCMTCDALYHATLPTDHGERGTKIPRVSP